MNGKRMKRRKDLRGGGVLRLLKGAGRGGLVKVSRERDPSSKGG